MMIFQEYWRGTERELGDQPGARYGDVWSAFDLKLLD